MDWSDQSFLVPRFSRPLSSDIALPFGYVATATSRNLDRHLLIRVILHLERAVQV